MNRERRIYLGFAVLCLLSGSDWIFGQFWTSPLNAVQGMAVQDGAAALALAGVLAARRLPLAGIAWKRFLFASFWGAMLFALPTLVAAGARGHVEQFTSALIYTLVPALVLFIVAQQQSSFGVVDNRLGLMLPALAGCGGAALLFPFRQPDTLSGCAWFAAVLLAAGLSGYAAVRLHGLLLRGELLAVAAGSTTLAAMCAGLVGAAMRTPLTHFAGADYLLEAGSWIGITLPSLLLALWLLKVMPPVRFAARYLLIPAVTIVEGLALLRPEVSWTTPLGVMLLLGAGTVLLRARRDSVQDV